MIKHLRKSYNNAIEAAIKVLPNDKKRLSSKAIERVIREQMLAKLPRLENIQNEIPIH